MSDTARDLTCRCGAMLSEHSIDGQYDGGCARTGCHYFEEAKVPPKKDSLAQLRKERDAWRELAQARGHLLTAQRNEEYSKLFLIRGRDLPPIIEKLRELGIPEEQLR